MNNTLVTVLKQLFAENQTQTHLLGKIAENTEGLKLNSGTTAEKLGNLLIAAAAHQALGSSDKSSNFKNKKQTEKLPQPLERIPFKYRSYVKGANWTTRGIGNLDELYNMASQGQYGGIFGRKKPYNPPYPSATTPGEYKIKPYGSATNPKGDYPSPPGFPAAHHGTAYKAEPYGEGYKPKPGFPPHPPMKSEGIFAKLWRDDSTGLKPKRIIKLLDQLAQDDRGSINLNWIPKKVWNMSGDNSTKGFNIRGLPDSTEPGESKWGSIRNALTKSRGSLGRAKENEHLTAIAKGIGGAAIIGQKLLEVAMPGEGFIGSNTQGYKQMIQSGADSQKDLSTWLVYGPLGMIGQAVGGIAKGIF